ncbi:MAG: hypothetical protein O3B87_03230 [bacterium]|nr:hypothetical protein [bacterium]
MIENIFIWQSLIGSAIGAMSPFLLWWVTDSIRKSKNYYDNLYYLERLIVDQANNVLEAESTIRVFSEVKIKLLIQNIKENNQNSYSGDAEFFPLFSMVSLPDSILNVSTKSGYIDNKIGKLFQLSRDMPHIINDLRKQFSYTIEGNREMVILGKNSPRVQKDQYTKNLENYQLMLEEQLEKSFPVFLKVLFQTREALNNLRKIGLQRWRIKFDPRFQFFISNEKYLNAQEMTFERIDRFFEKSVISQLDKIKSKKKLK